MKKKAMDAGFDGALDVLRANGFAVSEGRDGVLVTKNGAGAVLKVVAILPFAMVIGLYALELLVAFLQAYVFTMLTCMYLNDALHPGGH